jgi:hypothetical protein
LLLLCHACNAHLSRACARLWPVAPMVQQSSHLQVHLLVHCQCAKQMCVHIGCVHRMRPAAHIERCTHGLCLADCLHTWHALKHKHTHTQRSQVRHANASALPMWEGRNALQLDTLAQDELLLLASCAQPCVLADTRTCSSCQAGCGVHHGAEEVEGAALPRPLLCPCCV